MTNNLRKIKQDLCAYIKRCKDVHYSDSLLITFLMSGMIFARNNLFSAPADPVEAQKTEITNSIHSIRQQFRQARSENNKLLKATNLELTKLMEQGDHVTKSPWSSWQFGINYFNNNWNGTYKGRGDKKEKYPYEGVFQRSLDVYERAVSPDSDRYSLLSRSASPYSASSNARQGIPSGYGIASTKKVTEPIVGFEVNAGIRPKTVNKSPITIAAKTANVPVLPGTIGFVPPTVSLPHINTVSVIIPNLTPPATWNGDAQWANGTNVALISQARMNGGSLDINAERKKYTVNGTITSLIGISGSNHTETNYNSVTYTNESRDANVGATPQYRPYAVMKLIGGQKINIDNVTFNFRGQGTANSTYSGAGSWLFHTDGHNNYGDSTWVLGNGTKVNITGEELIMYTSQYHSGGNFNIGFQNNGEISDIASSKNNYIWISMNDGGVHSRVMWFDNKNSLILRGENDVFALLGHESNPANTPDGGGFSIMNSGTLNLEGKNQIGILVNKNTNGRPYDDNVYNGAEIIFTKPMKITGSKSKGIIFNKFVNLY